MALIKCGECGHEVSNQARTCPNCGARMRKAVSRVQILMWVVLLSVLSWFFFGGGNERSALQDWQKIRTQVASEAVASYQIAKKAGDAKGMCVQAGEAATAFLQMHDEARYQTWKDTEKADCRAAGMAH